MPPSIRSTLIRLLVAEGATPHGLPETLTGDPEEAATFEAFLRAGSPAKMGQLLVGIAQDTGAPPTARISAATKAAELWRDLVSRAELGLTG